MMTEYERDLRQAMNETILEIEDIEGQINELNQEIERKQFCTDDDYECMEGLNRQWDHLQNDVLIPILRALEGIDDDE